MTALLIKNARVFAPQDLGKNDVLMVNDRIAAVGQNLAPQLPDLEILDAGGKILTPGFFDQHIHVTSRAAAARADRQHVRRNSCFRN